MKLAFAVSSMIGAMYRLYPVADTGAAAPSTG